MSIPNWLLMDFGPIVLVLSLSQADQLYLLNFLLLPHQAKYNPSLRKMALFPISIRTWNLIYGRN